MRQRTLYALVAVVIIMAATSSGHILAIRLWGEEATPGPELGEKAVYSWEATSLLPPDEARETVPFQVDPGTSELLLHYDIALPFALMDPVLPTYQIIHLEPFVDLRLAGPGGGAAWEGSFNFSDSGNVSVQLPEPGEWSPRIEARGYHLEMPGYTVSDSLYVRVFAS